MAGVFGIPFIEDQAGQPEEVAGVGGTALVIENSNDVSAAIHDWVKLNAETLDVNAVNAAKQLTMGVSGGKAETIGVNGTVSVLDIDNNTIAQIDSNAEIVTGDDTIKTEDGEYVKAEDGEYVKTEDGEYVKTEDGEYVKAEDGEYVKAEDGEYVKAEDGEYVKTEDGEYVKAEDGKEKYAKKITIEDVGKTVRVNAVDDSRIIEIIGGVSVSKNVGIGFSVGNNDITRNTQAVIGNLADTESQAIVNRAVGNTDADVILETDIGNLITSQGDIGVNAANEGYILSLALAGAAAVEREDKTSKTTLSVNNSNSATNSQTSNSVFSKIQDSLEGVYVTVSGEWLDNDIDDDTKAYIRHVTLNADNLDVKAVNDADVWALAGGFALNYTSATANGGNTKASVGIAGAWSDNFISGTTTAYAEDATLNVLKKLGFDATTTRDIKALAASGSANINSSASSSFNGTLAGSVTNNELANSTLSYLQNTTVKSNDLSVIARDSSSILSGAGAVSISIGNNSGSSGGSVGLSWADNEGSSNTQAYLKDSQIEAGGAIAIEAENNSKINTLSATLGVTNQGGAIVASISINDLANNTQAYISGGSLDKLEENTIDSLSVTAKDISSIGSIAGQVAIANKAAVGFAFAWNEIENKTKSYVENANLNNIAGDIAINAISDNEIEAYAVGGSFASDRIAAAGSTAINSIGNSTEAYSNNSNITSNGDLKLKAQDDSEIFAIAGGVAASTGNAAIGAAVAINEIGEEEKKLQAYILGGTVTTTGNVQIEALANTQFFSTSVGGSGASSLYFRWFGFG